MRPDGRRSLLGIKRPGYKVDHSPPSSAEPKDVCSQNPTALLCLHGADRENLTFYFYLKATEWEGMEWIHLAQDEAKFWLLVTRYWNISFHKMAGKFLTLWRNVSFSRRNIIHRVSQSASQVACSQLGVSLFADKKYIRKSTQNLMHTALRHFLCISFNIRQVTNKIWHTCIITLSRVKTSLPFRW
jgi:hypothetical protein